MKKILYALSLLLFFTACNRHALPPFTWHNNDDTTIARKKVLSHTQLRPEYFLEDSTIHQAPPSGFRKEPITAPNPIKFPCVPIDTCGRVTNRVNIVFCAEGYIHTKYDSLKFINDCKAIVTAIKARAPFYWYPLYFNWWAVYSTSKDSGISNASAACGPVVSMNTIFNCAFNYAGTCRFISCNQTTVTNVLAGSMPYYDISCIVCNTPTYGGAAEGSTAITTANTLSTEVMIHELGHSLGGLGDEYSYSGCGGIPEWNCDTSKLNPRWKDTWVPWLPNTGWFLGSNYCPTTWGRDSANCEMRELNQPFCPQCKKRLIWSFNYYVNAIDAFSPGVGITKTDKFSIKVLQPIANTMLIKWSVNGIVKQLGRNTFIPAAGTYSSVSVVVYDTSKWLFTTLAPKYTQSWSNITVINTPPPPPACTVPSGLSVQSVMATSVQFTWQATNAVSYRLSLSGKIFTVIGPAYVNTALAPTTTYTAMVKSICAGDSSAWSSVITFTTPALPSYIPVVSISKIAKTTFFINWNKIIGPIGNVVTYDVRWQKRGQVGWNTASNIPGQVGADGLLFRKQQNLTRGTTYNVEMRTRFNATPVSDWSQPLTITTLK